jgi:hypothetical protein
MPRGGARDVNEELRRALRQKKAGWRAFFALRQDMAEARAVDRRYIRTLTDALTQELSRPKDEGLEVAFRVLEAAAEMFKQKGDTECPICLGDLANVDLRRADAALIRGAVMGKCGHLFCGGCAQRIAGQRCPMRCTITPFEDGSVKLDRSPNGIAADVLFHIVCAVVEARDADRAQTDVLSTEGFGDLVRLNISNGAGPEDAVERALAVLRSLPFLKEISPTNVARTELVLRRVHGAPVPEALESASRAEPTMEERRAMMAAAAENRVAAKRRRPDSSSEEEGGGKRQAVEGEAAASAAVEDVTGLKQSLPDSWTVIQARYKGKCSSCKAVMAQNSPIAALKGARGSKMSWVCATCALAAAGK